MHGFRRIYASFPWHAVLAAQTPLNVKISPSKIPETLFINNNIRVVGRYSTKNFLKDMIRSEAGATFFSLVETAKANGLEPYSYLRYIFEKLPLAETDQDYRNLLPQFVDREDLFASLP